MWRDRGLVTEMIDRARVAGFEALMITVDTAVFGKRDRDVRRGFELPPKIGLETLIDGALHPGWTLDFLRNDPIMFANVAGRADVDGSDAVTLSDYINAQFDPSLSWADLDWIRTVWDGPIIIKGIQTVEDAVLAADAGVDAISLSNHGGRQLDSAPRHRRPGRPGGPGRGRPASRSSATGGCAGAATWSRPWRWAPPPAPSAGPTSTAWAREASAASTTCWPCSTATSAAPWPWWGARSVGRADPGSDRRTRQ